MRRAGAYLRLSTLTSSQSALTSVSGKSQRLSPKTAFAPLLLLSPRKRRAFVGTPFDFSPGGGSTRYISVALVRGFPLAGVTRYPCPVEPGLSSRTGFRRVRAAAPPLYIIHISPKVRLPRPEKIILHSWKEHTVGRPEWISLRVKTFNFCARYASIKRTRQAMFSVPISVQYNGIAS